MPPTSSPLHSALHFLKEILSTLRERCAPIRDETVDSLYAALDAWRDPIPGANAEVPTEASSSPLAMLIVNTIRETVTLADQMKADLNTAVIGALGEDEVRAHVVGEAKAKERELVLELWGVKDTPHGQSLREKWRSWVASLPQSIEAKFGNIPSDRKWIVRLMEQLATNSPVTCTLPHALLPDENMATDEEPLNALPPHFLFVVPKLVYIQNSIQAITIAASLRSLTRLPVVNGSGHDFMLRVWTLLKGEIDDDFEGKTSELGSIKLINLSDEVVRARRTVSENGNLDPEEESRLRAAVERTLKPDDPVFRLLHRRLADTLTQSLLETLCDDGNRDSGVILPQAMRTGRVLGDPRSGKRSRAAVPDHTASVSTTNTIRTDSATAPVTVKGFEDPILAHAAGDVHRALIGCITWVQMVWGDMVW